jgi:hypothetical protein
VHGNEREDRFRAEAKTERSDRDVPRQGNAADIPGGLATPAVEIKLVEANMAKPVVDLSENPASTDELVRDLEDSGYPVDGSREQFIRQPDGLSAATGGLAAAPAELDKRSAQRTCATPSDDRGTTGGDVSKQGNAAEVAEAS